MVYHTKLGHHLHTGFFFAFKDLLCYILGHRQAHTTHAPKDREKWRRLRVLRYSSPSLGCPVFKKYYYLSSMLLVFIHLL